MSMARTMVHKAPFYFDPHTSLVQRSTSYDNFDVPSSTHIILFVECRVESLSSLSKVEENGQEYVTENYVSVGLSYLQRVCTRVISYFSL